MKNLFQLFLFSTIFIGNVFAFGESGFLRQGKKFVVYRDGIKVGKSFAELYKVDKKKDRSIASESETAPQIIYYIRDETRHCYYSKKSGEASDLSCVK